jgi:hypothetical protein
MSDDKFQRMSKSIPSLYKPETNTYIRGLLKSWGLLDDQITVEIQNTKEQLFVETAQAKNLDRLGSNVGVTRSSELGIDDGDFRGLVPVLSFFPKQVRRTIISLLDVFWGEGFTRPNISSGNTEPFNFGPETALTGTLTFKKGELIVRGIGTNFLAELQPGDYIKPALVSGLQYMKVSGVIDNTTLQLSIAWDDNTSVNVAAQKGTTQTLIYKVDGLVEKTIRFIPSAFEDLTAVTLDELVAFLNSNGEHKPHLTASIFLDPVLGSKLNLRTNTPGLRGSIQILGGSANAPTILNFAAQIATETRAKVIEINPNEIVVQIPSSVPVLRRTLKGSAHPRESKAVITSNREVYDFSTLAPTSTLTLTVDGSPFVVTFTNATDFADATAVTAREVAIAINSQLLFLKASVGDGGNDVKRVALSTTEGSSEYQITGGTANTLLGFSTTLQQDPDLLDATFPSAYVFDPVGQLFTVTGTNSELAVPVIAGDVSSTLNLANASSFPNIPGKFILDFGRADQEGPISYTSRPNNATLLIDASYQFQKSHAAGRKVNLIADTPSIPRVTGDDYAFTVTGTEEARQAAQDLIKRLLASGVVIRFIIDFPEFLFVCECRDCGPSESPNYIGSRSGLGPLVF